MAKATAPDPLIPTPEDKLGKEEHVKLDSNRGVGHLDSDFLDMSVDDIIKESEFLAKSQGIYLEYNRSKTGREKDWMYMVRASIPGGGSFTAEQWRVFDRVSDDFCDHNPYGTPTLRLTTRQNIQYHWVPKRNILPLIQALASTGFYTLNGCGDNVRNVMGCPLSKFSDVYDANAKAREYGAYFQLPAAPHIQIFAVDPSFIRDAEQRYDYGPKLLNRKFKVAFSSVTRDAEGKLIGDNCVELRTNDLGVAPIAEGDKVVAYQVYIGGGQGEKNGKPTFAALGVPFGIFTEDNLLRGLHDIVKVHEDYGDRANRHWARLKYVVKKMGIDWYQEQVRAKGATFEPPNPDFDPGARMMHHGWTKQETNGKWSYGAYIECGRLVNSTNAEGDPEHKSGNVQGNGNLKAMVPATLEAFPGVEVMVSPNQDLLFINIEEAAKEDFAAKLAEFGYGKRKGKAYSTLRLLSGSCVGLPTCRLSYTDSEQFEPELMDQLDEMGYGDVQESIGITGCERQCFRPATKTFGWVGQGPNMYMLKLGGSEDGRHLGTPLVEDEKLFLRQVPRDKVAAVTTALIDLARANGYQNGDDMGAIFRNIGTAAILQHLRENEATAGVMEKTAKAPFLPTGPTTG